MSKIAEELKEKLAALSSEDRAELAFFLIHSLDGADDPDWESAWRAELKKRSQEIENGTEQGEPADKVFAELREKYS